MRRLRALNAIACERGQSLAQMALAWILADKRTTSVIVGASSVEQLADNIKAIRNTTFTAEELTRIESLVPRPCVTPGIWAGSVAASK